MIRKVPTAKRATTGSLTTFRLLSKRRAQRKTSEKRDALGLQDTTGRSALDSETVLVKRNRDRSRLSTLKSILANANRTSVIEDVQSLPSPEVVLLQLCDVLLGAASSRLNERENMGAAKMAIVEHLERRLDRHRLGPTSAAERKFNVFRIRLQGGW